MRRGFKGIWIPAEIWLDEELSFAEKFMLAEIDSLDNENGCYASNSYFSKFSKLSKNRCGEIVKMLEQKGKISVEYEKKGNSIQKRNIRVKKSIVEVVWENEDTEVVEKPTRVVENSTEVVENPNHINIINKIDIKERKKEKKTFDEIIENYTENENLQNELKEHLKVRKTKRAALTDHAIELSLKRLSQIASTDAEKIQIVQNAIMSGWTSFYPLQNNNSKAKEASKVVKTEIDPELLARRNGYG